MNIKAISIIENSLTIAGSNGSLELVNIFLRKFSNLVVDNKIKATIKLKGSAFLTRQNVSNIKNNKSRRNQKTGLENVK